MKQKLLFFAVLCFIGFAVKAQTNVFPADGNVGIGTTSPQAPLHIYSTYNTVENIEGTSPYIYAGLTFTDHTQTTAGKVKQWAIWAGTDGGTWLSGLGFQRYDAVNPCLGGICDLSLFLHDNGNVGIGTGNPQAKLDVNGTTRIKNGELQIVGDNLDIGGTLNLINTAKTGNGQASNWKIYNMGGAYRNSLQFWAYDNLGCTSGGMCAPRLTIMDNGNVGIGTNNPQAKLDVDGEIHVAAYFPIQLAASDINHGIRYAGANSSFANNLVDGPVLYGYSGGALGIKQGSTETIALRWNGMGNIGIGTNNPQAKLDVNGEIHVAAYFPIQLAASDINHGIRYAGANSLFANNLVDGPVVYGYSGGALGIKQGSTETIALRWNGMGNVGIGTTAPDQKLTVKGKIHAEEVIVDLNVPVADYVFAKDYDLMPLHKVEQYVKQNSHLPEIPSASEIKEHGLSMGEMQNKLLKKIEELTLYAIEQNKKMESQQQEIQALKSEIKQMKR